MKEEVKRDKRLRQQCHYRGTLLVKAKKEEALASRTIKEDCRQ